MSLPRLTNENLRKDLIQTNYCEISIREGAFFIAFFREGGGIVSYKQRHSYLMKKLYISATCYEEGGDPIISELSVKQ